MNRIVLFFSIESRIIVLLDWELTIGTERILRLKETSAWFGSTKLD